MVYFIGLLVLLLGTLHVIHSFINIKKKTSRIIYYSFGSAFCILVAFFGLIFFYRLEANDRHQIQYAREYDSETDIETTSYLIVENKKQIQEKEKQVHLETQTSLEQTEEVSDQIEVIFTFWSLNGFTIYGYIDGEKTIITVNEDGYELKHKSSEFNPLWPVMDLFKEGDMK